MIRFRRLAVLLVPLAIGLASYALPGRAQQALSARFAFADTTLLRDTLGLDFTQLFPTADSLGVLPDSLRAVMIRFRLGIGRVLTLADSLGVPFDSLASTLQRERLNPLAVGAARRRNDLSYSTTYNVAQTTSSWTNGADYNYSVGPLFLRNLTNITMDRYQAGGKTSLRQTRSANTESGWRFSPGVSLGGRVNLDRFDTRDPGAVDNEGETKNEFQVSTRTRQTLRKNVTSELNLFTGYLDLKNASQVKRGMSGDLSGRFRIAAGQWFTHDLGGQVTGNVARTRLPSSIDDLRTTDFSNNLRGTMNALSASPASFNVNYQLRRTRVETPSTTGIQSIVTRTNGADGTVRLRLDNDRYLNITGRLNSSAQSTGSRDDRSANWAGRYGYRGWSLDGSYTDGRTTSRFIRRGAAGGYDEFSLNRTSDVTLAKSFSAKITGKLNGSIGLNQYRYGQTAPGANLPIDRDGYRQSYRIEGLYNRSENLNTGLALEVSLSSAINIPARATSSNSDTRTYRAEWRWNYRLLPGLTVNQINTLSADYRFYTFTPERNDLSLDYSTLTTLSAILTPRLSLDVTHNGRFQPKGNYGTLADGRDYFKPADEGQNYALRSRITYSPTPAFSLTLAPDYSAVNRIGTVGGVEVPQRQTRALNMSGGANLNIRLGRAAQLTGNINRTYQSSRVTSYQSGLPQASPRSESDFWNGSLQLSWQP